MQLLKELYVFRREEKKQCKIGCMVELNYNFLIYQSEDQFSQYSYRFELTYPRP